VHSALPGALRRTGRLEKGRLVLRGDDSRTSEKTSVRLVLEDLSTKGWTQVFEEQPEGSRMERVVTTVVRKSAKKPDPR
jgi:hypothetical protein